MTSIGCVLPMPKYCNTQEVAQILNAIRGRPVMLATGALWNVAMERAFEKVLSTDVDYIICIDGDSGFMDSHLSRIEQTIHEDSSFDALAAYQMHRSEDRPLFSGADQNGTANKPFRVEKSAHLGLTALKAEHLRSIDRPWFRHPEEFHDDVGFWRNWTEAGGNIYVEPRCSIGHFEPGARYFDKDWKPQFKRLPDWLEAMSQ